MLDTENVEYLSHYSTDLIIFSPKYLHSVSDHLKLVIYDVENLGQGPTVQSAFFLCSYISKQSPNVKSHCWYIGNHKIGTSSEFGSSWPTMLINAFQNVAVFPHFADSVKNKNDYRSRRFLNVFKNVLKSTRSVLEFYKRNVQHLTVATQLSLLSPGGKNVAWKTVTASNISGIIVQSFAACLGK